MEKNPMEIDTGQCIFSFKNKTKTNNNNNQKNPTEVQR